MQSISRAFAVLRLLATGPQRVTDVADDLSLPKSTVVRLLTALESVGAVSQRGVGGEYSIGQGIIDLAGAASGDQGLIAASRPYLQDLAERVNETAGVSIRIGRSAYYLDQVEPLAEVQVRSWIGEYIPLHLVPSGLVHLAHADRAEVAEYASGGLEATTPHSIADPETLSVQLDRIRSCGYAWVFEGFALGLNSAAAPVLRPDSTVIAALHIHGPAYRFPDQDRVHEIGALLTAAASGLADSLAGHIRHDHCCT